MSLNGNLPQIEVNIKKKWNHHLATKVMVFPKPTFEKNMVAGWTGLDFQGQPTCNLTAT